MPRFPLRIPVPRYSGNDESRRRKYLDQVALACQIEEYINGRHDPASEQQSFMYYAIAKDLGVTTEDVRQLLRNVGHGANGITLGSEPVADGDLD